MGTTYYLACKECTPPHVHKDESSPLGDYDGIAHSSGRWSIEPHFLDQSALIIDEYGDVMTVAEATKRTRGAWDDDAVR